MNLRLACLFALPLALPAAVAAGEPVPGPMAPFVAPGCLPSAGPYAYGGFAPYHWIYGYLPTVDHTFDRYGYGPGRPGYDRERDPDRTGRSYVGRDRLYPALPYSDYIKSRRPIAVPPAPEEEAKLTPAADRALLEVRVPTEAARVFFNGQLAAGEGTVRYFSTPPLTAGKEYRFKIKASWPGNDPFQDVTVEETVTFRAGEHKVVEMRPKR